MDTEICESCRVNIVLFSPTIPLCSHKGYAILSQGTVDLYMVILHEEVISLTIALLSFLLI